MTNENFKKRSITNIRIDKKDSASLHTETAEFVTTQHTHHTSTLENTKNRNEFK